MAEFAAIRNRNRRPTHPGVLLGDAINATGITKSDCAARLGISRQHLYDLLSGEKPVSPSIAVKLGKLFGQGGGLWLRMQTAHDLWEAERQVDTSNIRTLEPA